MRGLNKIKRSSKRLAVSLSCIILIFTLTACGAVVKQTFVTMVTTSGSAKTVDLSVAETAKVTALLGDLNGDVPVKVKGQLGELLHKTELLVTEREAKGNYEMSENEYELWEKITALLDKETIRQYGKDYYQEDKPDPKLDYGKDTMHNLKKTLCDEDWQKLNKIRNEYFKAAEEEFEDYDVDTEMEIRSITEKYKELDSDAVVLNLLDEKNQKNFGMFEISKDLEAIYQDGGKNGLKPLSVMEQSKLKKTWKAVADVIPLGLFSNFQYFKVGGDGELGTYASVIPVDGQGKKWCMTVDPADVTDDGLFPYTAVHEMTHYLTLNEKQVKYYQDDEEFYPHEWYSDWECVAKEGSYLQGYYSAFWKDIINDWATNPDNIYFYYRHQSEFVTGYASTECAEDLAECFSAYVLLKSADTPEIQAKFDFFDSYPELRRLKQDILKKIKDNKVYVNPEIEPQYEEDLKGAA